MRDTVRYRSTSAPSQKVGDVEIDHVLYTIFETNDMDQRWMPLPGGCNNTRPASKGETGFEPYRYFTRIDVQSKPCTVPIPEEEYTEDDVRKGVITTLKRELDAAIETESVTASLIETVSDYSELHKTHTGSTPNKILEWLQKYVPALNVPGQIFINRFTGQGNTDFYTLKTEGNVMRFEANEHKQYNIPGIPTDQVIDDKVNELMNPKMIDGTTKPIPAIRFMLGASGAGKSTTTANMLNDVFKTAKEEKGERQEKDDEIGLTFTLRIRAMYGTAEVGDDTKKGGTAEVGDATTKVANEKQITINAHLSGNWDTTVCSLTETQIPPGSEQLSVLNLFKRAAGRGEFSDAVTLLENVCQCGQFPGFEGLQMIAQTGNNVKSSRGGILWWVTVDDTKKLKPREDYVIVDLPGTERAFEIMSDFYAVEKERTKLMTEQKLTQQQAEDRIVTSFVSGDAEFDIDVNRIGRLLTEASNEQRKIIQNLRDKGVTPLTWKDLPNAFVPDLNIVSGGSGGSTQNKTEIRKYATKRLQESLYITLVGEVTSLA